MGIRLNCVDLLSKTLPLLGNLCEKKLLALGVQDCYFTYGEVISFLKRHGIPFTPLNHEEIQLTSGFKWVPSSDSEKYQSFIHQNTLFRLLGFRQSNICSMDINEYEVPLYSCLLWRR